MFLHKPNYSSQSVNTDAHGLRFTQTNSELYSPETHVRAAKTSVLVGGSTAFGVGASSDAATIPSRLHELSGEKCLNLGGRAYTSTQELLLFQTLYPHIGSIQTVFILSGLNDLFLTSRLHKTDGFFDYFFFQSQFHQAMITSTLSRKRRLLRDLLAWRLGREFPYESASAKDFLHYLKGQPRETQENDHDLDTNELIGQRISTAIEKTTRNLRIWSAISKAERFKLVFALQPLPIWMGRVTSDEENQLFLDLNSIGSPDDVHVVEHVIRPNHGRFASEIQDLCNRLDVKFVDMNAELDKPEYDRLWMFVDRAHLTDLGSKLVAKVMANFQ